MGYKLAGFDLAGCVEIDTRMLRVYEKNLAPKKTFNMPIQNFNKIPVAELPQDLRNLDVLDGSPPCSVFSMAGSREKKWGKAHAFREGQAVQRLDDLFFHFIDTAANLKPKVVVAENVKGMLAGNAKGYVIEVVKRLKQVGYTTQVFLLNSAKMGVPQRRERVFFVSRRNDLLLKPLNLSFDQLEIPVSEAISGVNNSGKPMSAKSIPHWKLAGWGGLFSHCGANSGKMNRRLHPKKPSWTLTASDSVFHWSEPRWLSNQEITRISSFPEDYDYGSEKAAYICGMSVPPYMMRAIATQIKLQWLS